MLLIVRSQEMPSWY